MRDAEALLNECVDDGGPRTKGLRLRLRGGRKKRGTRAGARVRRGRGDHFSAAAGRNRFEIYFGNATSWSEQAEDHVMNLGVDAFLGAEIHLKRNEVSSLLKNAGRAGWEATVGPAQQSSLSERGSNGGVVAMVHSRWCSAPWAIASDDEGRLGPFLQPRWEVSQPRPD